MKSSRYAEQVRFYADTLGFSVDDQGSSATIQVGSTQMVLQADEDQVSFYHFAFLIPDAHFEQALAYVKYRDIEIIPNRESGSDITYWENQTGRSFYFFDPDGNIAEFITRPTLGYESSNDFSIREVIKMNEIGTPVPDPMSTVETLERDFGIPVEDRFKQHFSSTFCWYGDYSGVLLVVREGRNWYPTQLAAISSDLEIDLEVDGQRKSLAFNQGKFRALEALR
jgi:catechol 2,3-dioxygenase-like lactoylglutathione lyase family enzyme